MAPGERRQPRSGGISGAECGNDTMWPCPRLTDLALRWWPMGGGFPPAASSRHRSLRQPLLFLAAFALQDAGGACGESVAGRGSGRVPFGMNLFMPQSNPDPAAVVSLRRAAVRRPGTRPRWLGDPKRASWSRVLDAKVCRVLRTTPFRSFVSIGCPTRAQSRRPAVGTPCRVTVTFARRGSSGGRRRLCAGRGVPAVTVGNVQQ